MIKPPKIMPPERRRILKPKNLAVKSSGMLSTLGCLSETALVAPGQPKPGYRLCLLALRKIKRIKEAKHKRERSLSGNQ
jgi:hypothetical protein